jgi:predicted Zn-dependent protease
VALLIVVGGLTAAGLQMWRPAGNLPPGLLMDEYTQAEQRYREMYRRKPGRTDVLSLAGELAVKDNRLANAVSCFRAIPTADPRYGLSARLQEGQVLLRLNRALDAEKSFREYLAQAAHNPRGSDHVAIARKWLAYLLSVELRQEERKILLSEIHAEGGADVYDSKQYFFPNLLLWHTSTGRRRLTEFLAEDPENPMLRTAEGRYLTAEGRLDEALALLEELGDERPQDPACIAALLECCFERNDWEGFAQVARLMPEFEQGEPWLLTRMRGERALHERTWEEAVRQFARVLESDPANPWSHAGLARAYAELGQTRKRDEEQRRSLVLSRIRVSLVTVKEDDGDAAVELASKCAEIGLDEAADVFRGHAARIRSSPGLTP